MEVGNIGSNTRRLMKIRKISIAKLSSQMEMGSATLSNILNGKSEPKSSTLLKLADALNVSVNDLMADSPKLNNIRFRSKKTLSAREKAEKDQTVINTAIWLKNFNYLEEQLGKQDIYSFTDIAAEDRQKDMKNLANKVRILLNIKDPKEPVYDLANLIEDAGIKLRIYDFGYRKNFGLSVGKDENGPAIVVNSYKGISVERQIFTITHELGHLLMHFNSYAPDETKEIDKQEKETNEFAGHFLLPDEGLKHEWNESKGLHWVDSVLRIKKIYKVSYQLVLLRLSQINKEFNNAELRKNFAIQYYELYNHNLKNHYEPDALSRNDLIEDRFSKLVREAYEKEIISLSRAGEMLGESADNMRRLAASWREVSIEL